MATKSFSKPGRSSVDCARRTWPQDEDQPFAAGLKQVIGDRMADAAIVNADQIVIAAARILNVVAVQQHERKLGVIEGVVCMRRTSFKFIGNVA